MAEGENYPQVDFKLSVEDVETSDGTQRVGVLRVSEESGGLPDYPRGSIGEIIPYGSAPVEAITEKIRRESGNAFSYAFANKLSLGLREFATNKGEGEKTLGNTDANGARKNVPDLQTFGDADAWQLLCKASSESEGWMKSTKAMVVPGGCLVQVTTQQRNPDSSYAVAESVTFVPGVVVDEDGEGNRWLAKG